MHRLDISTKITSADADVLAGSALDPMPSDGYVRIYVASTVNTATLSIVPSKHTSPTGPGTQAVMLRANGEIRSYDMHWETRVGSGEKVAIAVAGTTGTVYVHASFVGRD